MKLLAAWIGQVEVRLASDSTAIAFATMDSLKRTLTLDETMLAETHEVTVYAARHLQLRNPAPRTQIVFGKVGVDALRLCFRKQ